MTEELERRFIQLAPLAETNSNPLTARQLSRTADRWLLNAYARLDIRYELVRADRSTVEIYAYMPPKIKKTEKV